MSEERDFASQWGDDPENDRYTGRSAAFIPTDWSDNLTHKDYVKNKHLNAISKALWSLRARNGSVHYISYAELVAPAVSPPLFFRAARVTLNQTQVCRDSVIKFHIARSNQDYSNFSSQTITWNRGKNLLDSGNGKFTFIFVQANGPSFDLWLPMTAGETFIWSWWTECTAESSVINCLPGDSLETNVGSALGTPVTAGTTGTHYYDDDGNLILKGYVNARNGISGGNTNSGAGYHVGTDGFVFSSSYNGVQKICQLALMAHGLWNLAIHSLAVTALTAVSATISGDIAAASATISGSISAVNATISGVLSAVSATISNTLTVGDTTNYSGVANIFGTLNFGASGKRKEPAYLVTEAIDISELYNLDAGVRRTFLNETATPITITYHPSSISSQYSSIVHALILSPFKSVEFVSVGSIGTLGKGAWVPLHPHDADVLWDSVNVNTSSAFVNSFKFAPLEVSANVALNYTAENTNMWKAVYNSSSSSITVQYINGANETVTNYSIPAYATRVFIGLGSGKWSPIS